MSSSRSSTVANKRSNATTNAPSSLLNGSSSSSTVKQQSMMMDGHHRSRMADGDGYEDEHHLYGNDNTSSAFRAPVNGPKTSEVPSRRQQNTSSQKGSHHTSSSSASSSPSLSLPRGDNGPNGPSKGGGSNLVKQLVDSLYINAKSPVPSLLSSSSRSSFRGAGPVISSPSTSQRSFTHNLNLSKNSSEPSYDNLPSPSSSKSIRGLAGGSSNSQQKQSSPTSHQDSPSLDRKSATRASLPMGSSQHPYYYTRSGSGLSNASSNASSSQQQQMYGQINSNSNANNNGVSSSRGPPKYLLDGDPLPVVEAVNQKTSPKGPKTTSATWVEILEPKSRHKMFANLSTGECRWEEPKGVSILRANNPNITQWWELYDQRTGRFYYYSSRDFKTIWQKPTSPDAVVVPLAKLQILKQNTTNNSHLNDSFDSGTGNGSSSGQVTPSSPSALGSGGSPSHLFNARIKAWANGGSGSPFGPISSPVAAPPPSVTLTDAATQTANSALAGMVKPTMVSRWTQTSNLTPTHSASSTRVHQSHHHPNPQYPHHQQQRPRPGPQLVNGEQHQAKMPQQGHHHQPSLHHYLLSEKRFAKGRYSVPPESLQQHPQQESIYDPVYGSGQPGLIYGNGGDFYDIVASDPAPNQAALAGGHNRRSGGDYYEDVYDGSSSFYYDEEEDYLEDEDYFEDESEEDEGSECDADDEFAGGEESLESEDEEEEDETEEDDEDECDFDELDSLEDHPLHHRSDMVDGQRHSVQQYHHHQQDVVDGQFIRGHNHRQALQQPVPSHRSSIKVSATSSKIPPSTHQNEPKNGNNQQTEGIRMSASFSAVDFKRNALGRSSYTAVSSQLTQQPRHPVSQNVAVSSVQQQLPQAQSYSNPFNSGSLRSSTGRIGITAALSQAPSIISQQQQQQRSNIAERIQLFNQKSGPGASLAQQQQQSHQSSPSPLIIHRTPSSPPGASFQQNLTSTPNVAGNASTARHSSGSSNAVVETTANLQRYFGDRSPQPGLSQPSIVSSTGQQPSKSHSLSQIAPPQLPASTANISNNSGRQNLSSLNSSSDNYYALPPSSSSEALSLTPQIGKRSFLGSFGVGERDSNVSANSTETARSSGRLNLTNTLGHSLSVDVHRVGSGHASGPHSASSTSPSGPIAISSSTSAINRTSGGGQGPNSINFLGSFNDSHVVMLNKSQSVVAVPPGHGKSQQKGQQQNANKKTKESSKEPKTKSKKTSKENKAATGSTSPTKKKKAAKSGKSASKDSTAPNQGPPANTSIESFARECVARHRKGGIFSAKKTLKSMLTHTKKPLKRPMISTISDSTLVKEAVSCFKLIQVYMGDRPASPTPEEAAGSNPNQDHSHQLSDEALLVRLINVCVSLVPLRDEVLVQVARQVTQNPCPASEARGLELMAVLFWYFTASSKLAAHLHAFLVGLQRNGSGEGADAAAIVRRKFEQQLYRARHTPHSVLFFRKPGSPEEVGRVLRCVRARHGGLFGETLAEGIVGTGGNEGGQEVLKKQTLPWPMVLLTEALLEPRHEDREGVFRCVGDMDDVHRLKMKIDTILPSDAHFAELIGRGRSSSSRGGGIYSIGKLTDAHDLHVIASTLKLYFRELREAVIPAELYLEALEAAHSPTRACALVLHRLPPVNRATLCYLIRFLQVFSAPEHVRDTKMDDANLSMVWAPNILRSLNPNVPMPSGGGNKSGALAAASANSANIYEQTRAEMSLVRTLIQHLDTNNASSQLQ